MDKKLKSKQEFFASANSYSGFISYFDKIFNSSQFDRIFVLKGGPGTGKSTLLKKVAREFENDDVSLELFRCSSDTNSLDGLILERENKRIAIMDGTAPHIRDAVIPGAVDVLINLGDAINNAALAEEKKRILELNLLKSNSYGRAYEKLAKSSIFDSNLKAELRSNLDSDALNSTCGELLNEVMSFKCDSSSEIRLFSSFSKEGYSSLSLKGLSQCYTVSGKSGSEYLLLTELSHKLEAHGVRFVKIISPLDKHIVEGIYFKESSVAIVGGQDENCLIHTENFMNAENDDAFERKLGALNECKNIYENEAAIELKSASLYHFELEKIYTKAVDFTVIDRYTTYIKDGISKIFL